MNTIEQKTVEEWVNSIDYSDDPNYVPSSFALEFINFIKLVNGDRGEENKSPVMHYKMLDQLPGKRQDIANMCSRGTAKSALLAEYLFLYIAVYEKIPDFGLVDYALYVSDSIENGVKKMRKRIERRWGNSAFLRRYIPETRFTDVRWAFKNVSGKEFVVTGHGAQALSLDSILYTKTGITTIEHCGVGDRIYGPDGKLAKITAKSKVFYKPMYLLKFADGRQLKVSEDHINSVLVYGKSKDKTTLDLLTYPLYRIKSNGTKSYTFQVQNTKALQYTTKNFPLDPYTLGILLGDGSMKKDGSNVLHAHKDDMSHYINKISYTIGSQYLDKRNNSVISCSILNIHKMTAELGIRGISIKQKFIPTQYFYGSIEQRLCILQGLIDTDGSVSKEGKVTFTSVSRQLVDDVIRLVRGLGGTAKHWKGRAKLGKHRKLFKIGIWLNMHTASLPRKVTRERLNKSRNVALIDILKIPVEPSQCIAIDSKNHQYLTNDYTRTHNTGVRGTVELNTRPQLAILDDLLSDDDARSKTVIASIEDTVYKAIDHALHPTKRKVIWSGTPFNAKDPLYKAVESGAWYVNVYPICEKYPCTRAEFKGAWEDRFTYDAVKASYDKAFKVGKIDAFNQELMLRIMSDEDRLIQDCDINWFTRKTVIDNRGMFNFYITTDFATSEQTSSDYSVISVWAYNSNGDWLWVDGIVKKQLMDKNIADLFRLSSMYHPQQVGIEVSGQQGGFIQWIQNEMLTRNIYFNLASDTNSNNPGIRPNTNKLQRFNIVVPWFKLNRIKFPEERKQTPEMIEFMDELKLASLSGFKSKNDDCIDTISMLASLTPWKPSEAAVMQEDDNGLWELDVEEETDSLSSYIV